MGIILCDVHEASSMITGCKHVSRHINTKNEKEADITEPILKYVFITNLLRTVRLISLHIDYIYCNVCSKIYGFNERSFSSIIHVSSNFINIRKFADDCGYVCINCVCMHFLDIPRFDEKIYKSNFDKKIYLE